MTNKIKTKNIPTSNNFSINFSNSKNFIKLNLIFIFLSFNIKLTQTANLNEEEKMLTEEEQRRHSLSLLEPDFAENIFNREGSKNPIKRTTTIPLIFNRLEGINNKDQSLC